jgi:hypothetical protein
MKYLISILLIASAAGLRAQSIVGTWQQVDQKTCLQTGFKESDTEKELLPAMGPTKTAVAKLIRFDKKGRGDEGIFSEGSKKGSAMNEFQYRVNGQELQLLDKKSGIITWQFVIDELTEDSLIIHNAQKDCESRAFTKAKP